jgi:hypothetical protein
MRLEVVTASAMNEEEVDLLRATIEKLIDLGESGALSGERIAPLLSGLQSDRVWWGTDRAWWSFRNVRLDPATVCVILNALHSFHDQTKPLTAVSLSWADSAQLKDPLAVRFPRRHKAVPFALIVGDLDGSFDIVVEFHAEHDLAEVEKLDEKMGVWFSGASLGSYAGPFLRPAASRVYFNSDVHSLARDRIEWYIDALRCSEAAIDGLINLLNKLHHTTPLRSVTIGDFP